MGDQPASNNSQPVKVRTRQALIRGVSIEAPPPTLADQGVSMDADGTIRDNDGKPLIRVVSLPDLSPGVAVIASPVERSQQLNAGGEHVYLSTACLHGQHEHCRSAVAVDGGTKEPGTCKFCGAVCVCPVCNHTNADQT